MEDIFNHMDKFIIHGATLPRQFPAAMRVTTVARTPEKRDWITKAFHTLNFSFILRGTGEYHSPMGRFRVEAPCVITQWPDVLQKYGPDDEWDELYIVYEPEYEHTAKAMRLTTHTRRAWRCPDAAVLHESAKRLLEFSERAQEPGVMDQVDRFCEHMIVQSLTAPAPQIKDRRERVIREIQQAVQSEFLKDHDWEEIALNANLSPASFRRHWNRYVGAPPHKYLISLRMAYACRLLVETDMDVSEIADACAFEDPLYFSRSFHKQVGATATHYRRTHQTQ